MILTWQRSWIQRQTKRPRVFLSDWISENDENWKPKHDIQQVAIMLSGILVLQSHPERDRLIKKINDSNNAFDAISHVEKINFRI